MKALLEKIRRILRSRRTRQLLTRTVSVTAAIVVFITTYALILPAITLEKTAACGIEEHQHDESCYKEVLICNLPESKGHHHTDECYKVTKILTCDVPEHQHSEECYDSEGNLICELVEHTHGAACYEEQKELICGLEESEGHTHDSSCYEKVLICGKQPHIHSTECYKEDSSAVAASGDTAVAVSTAAASVAATDSAADTDDESYTGADKESAAGSEEVAVDGADDELDTGADDESAAGNDHGFAANTDGESADGTDDGFAAATDEFAGEAASQSGLTDVEGTSENTGSVGTDETSEDTGSAGTEETSENAGSAGTEETSENAGSFGTEGTSENTGSAGTEETSENEGSTSDKDDANTENTYGTESSASNGLTEGAASAANGLTEEAASAAEGLTEEVASAANGPTEEAASAAEGLTEEAASAANGFTEEAASAATTNVLPEPVKTEDLSEGYVPELDSIDFNAVLNKHTDFYYFHAEKEQNIPESSKEITDWKQVKNSLFGSTSLESDDLLRMYLSYTIPAGVLNETNQIARYRLPANLHLTDEQIIAINETENGMSLQYVNAGAEQTDIAAEKTESDENKEPAAEETETDESKDSAAEKTESDDNKEPAAEENETDESNDSAAIETVADAEKNEESSSEAAENYRKYLGVEAVEGTRTPDEELKEGTQEYISAIVKAENVYDEEGLYGEKGAYLGQDLIFVFTPYSIEKNQTTYDVNGNPVTAGEKITGWFACDFTLDQIDWVEKDTDLDNSSAEKTAEIVFAEENSEKGIKKISTSLKMMDDSVADTIEGGKADTASAAETAAAAEDVEEESKSKAENQYKSGTLTADGDGYRITLDYTEEAKIPENAFLSVHEITAETDQEAYKECLAQAEQQVAESTEDKTSVDSEASRFFDIEILVKDEETVEGGDSEDTEGTVAENGTDDAEETIDTEGGVDEAPENSDTENGTDEATKTADTESGIDEAPENSDTENGADEATEAADIENESDDVAETVDAENAQDDLTETDNDNTYNNDNVVRKIEPAAPVSVNIQILDVQDAALEEVQQSDPTVLHFAEEGVEKIESSVNQPAVESDEAVLEDDSAVSVNKDDGSANAGPLSESAFDSSEATEISFEAESFSIYGVVYTVDFHYEVNGKQYDFSIPGGGFISLGQIAESLGLALSDEKADAEIDTGTAVYKETTAVNNAAVSEETKEFVSQVENVDFTAPELLWVGKTETDTTVGALKEANGLEVQYSADLTEEQIKEINAQTVEAGDWALISMRPFTSDETLTVKMKNGDQFTVKVTDEQVTGQLTNGGKYLIYYNSGSGSNQTYYVLRNDGYVYSTTDSTDLDELGDEYLWTFDGFERDGEEYSLIHNGTTYLCLDGSSFGIFSNTAIPTYLEAINDQYKGFRVYGKEYWTSDFYMRDYLTFMNGIFFRSYSANTRIKLWEQAERKYKFTVKTEYNNAFRGTVSGYDQNNTYQSNVTSYIGITNGQKTNSNAITATAGEGYLFKEWRLGDTVLDITSSTIAAGSLTLTEDNMILTAVFEKDQTQPDVGFPDYSGKIEAWKQQNVEKPVVMDKTAQVFDYDNRIYEIGLDVYSEAKVIAPDVDMAFVTDVSRSMYTPAKLKEVGSYSTEAELFQVLNQLKTNRVSETQSADGDDVYYLMVNEDTTALVFAVRKIGNSYQYGYWKWIDCSYDTYKYNDKKGTTGVSGDDKTWGDGSNGGGYLSQRVYEKNVNGETVMKLIGDSFTLNGKIYIAEDTHYRLDYLTQAVDIVSDILYTLNADARTGLVTFDADVNSRVGLFGKNQYGELIEALNDISPGGGTNQKAGLDEAMNYWDTASDENHQRAVILITDGAPNIGKSQEESWAEIVSSAGNLYTQKNVTVHTVGLSIDDVDGAPEGLAATAAAGGNGKFLTASDGMGLVDSVLEIISTYLKEANYKGTLHDDIDPAFYPVKKDGTPITQGYYDVNGKSLTMEQVQDYNKDGTEYYLWKHKSGGAWSITWYNIEFGRGTDASPATHRDIYVKAREDFMGGNKINTNDDYAHAIATKAVFRNGQTTTNTPLEVTKEGMAETPYVNVDELHMTQHETSWTVYLGTDVTPKDQLKALWDNIMVKQVVKEGGTIPEVPGNEDNPDGTPADVTRMKDGDQMWYTHTQTVDQADEDAPANSAACSKLPLSYYNLDDYYDALLQAIISGNSYDSGDITYDAYNHEDVGTFHITAVKTIVDGAVDAVGKAPNQHTTDKAASPAETYKIIVTYTPGTSGAAETYDHTTTGGKAGKVTTGSGSDKVKSENTHIINVIKKGLAIEKIDEAGEKITDYNATFKLYRPATTNETGSSVTGLPEGSYKEVATLTTSSGTATLSNTLEELRMLPAGQHYYLVETQEPTGYQKLAKPIIIDVSVTSGEETKPYEVSEGITSLVNVGTPTAAVAFSGEGASKGTHTAALFVIKIENKSASVDITIHKVDEENTALPGASFKLMNGPEVVEISADGTGVIVEPVNSNDTVSISGNIFTIPSGGVSIKNLKASDQEYELIEVSAPDGYVITDNTPVKFKVVSGSVSDTTMATGVQYTPEDKDFTIPNVPGAELPSTGGSGTAILYSFGILLICIAAAGFFMEVRRVS